MVHECGAVWKRWVQKWAGRELATRWMIWGGVGVAMMWERKPYVVVNGNGSGDLDCAVEVIEGK